MRDFDEKVWNEIIEQADVAGLTGRLIDMAAVVSREFPHAVSVCAQKIPEAWCKILQSGDSASFMDYVMVYGCLVLQALDRANPSPAGGVDGADRGGNDG